MQVSDEEFYLSSGNISPMLYDLVYAPSQLKLGRRRELSTYSDVMLLNEWQISAGIERAAPDARYNLRRT